MKYKFKKSVVKRIISLILILSWLLVSWPGLPFFSFPPRVQKVKAITCGFGTEIGSTGVCRGFLTTTGSNQTWTSPSDWNNDDNTIECIGAGGSGGVASKSTTNVATGGGGGAYSLISDFYVADPGTTTATYRIGVGGTGVNLTSGTSAGNPGEDTWFNSSTFPGSGTDNTYCGSKGGSAGAAGTATQSGGAGGVDTSGWGETRRSGGSGGAASHSSVATGGGGAAGNSSTGGNGVSSTATSQATNGGQANGSGATGGTGGTTGGAGNDGTEYTTEGSGSGGGGGRNDPNGVVTGGSGGKRGGGGGAAVNFRANGNPSATSGAGYAGIIVITYTPIIDTTFTQNDWRIYYDNDDNSPADVWGDPDLAENQSLYAVPPSNDPVDLNDELRLRMNITIGAAQLPADTEGFILQYGEGNDCTAITSWTDVSAASAGTIWEFADSTVTDNASMSATLLSTSDRAGRYSKSNPTTTNPATVLSGEDLEWDWHVEYVGPQSAATYCFRMRKDTPADLDGYNSDCYPQVDIRPGTDNLMRHGNFFTSGSERGLYWVD